MKDNYEFLEIENRHCPICGKYIKLGSKLHHCSKRALNKIDKKEEIEELKELKELKEDRTYNDKLEECEGYIPDNYYDFEEE